MRAQIQTHMPQRHDVKAGPLASARESPNAVSPKKSDWSSAAATRWRLTRRTGAGAPAGPGLLQLAARCAAQSNSKLTGICYV